MLGFQKRGGLLGAGEAELLGVIGVVQGHAQDLPRGEGEEPGDVLGPVGLPRLVQEEAFPVNPLVDPSLGEKPGELHAASFSLGRRP